MMLALQPEKARRLVNVFFDFAKLIGEVAARLWRRRDRRAADEGKRQGPPERQKLCDVSQEIRLTAAGILARSIERCGA